MANRSSPILCDLCGLRVRLFGQSGAEIVSPPPIAQSWQLKIANVAAELPNEPKPLLLEQTLFKLLATNLPIGRRKNEPKMKLI